MAMVSVLIEKNQTKPTGFRAIAERHQSVGQTRGEALDALLADVDWEDVAQEPEVLIEPFPNEEYVEPHLVNRGGVWVIAGGSKMSPEDAQRDCVAEMREERIRSFFPDAQRDHDESSS